MARRDVWADFNGVDDQGHLFTLKRFAAPGVDIVIGDVLVVGDDEGRGCEALVIDIEGDVVELALKGSFFRLEGDREGSGILAS